VLPKICMQHSLTSVTLGLEVGAREGVCYKDKARWLGRACNCLYDRLCHRSSCLARRLSLLQAPYLPSPPSSSLSIAAASKQSANIFPRTARLGLVGIGSPCASLAGDGLPGDATAGRFRFPRPASCAPPGSAPDGWRGGCFQCLLCVREPWRLRWVSGCKGGMCLVLAPVGVPLPARTSRAAHRARSRSRCCTPAGRERPGRCAHRPRRSCREREREEKVRGGPRGESGNGPR